MLKFNNILKFLKKHKLKITLIIIIMIIGFIGYDYMYSNKFIDNFENDKKQKHVIFFYIPGCVHCEQLRPIWDAVVRDFKRDNVKIEEVNVTDDREKAELYGLSEFPQILLVEGSKKIMSYSGKRTYIDLKRWLENDIF